MNLVIFTPTIQESAIGRMAAGVSRALRAGGHEVSVVQTEISVSADASRHDFDAKITPWAKTSRVETLIRNADAVVYQIGDNWAMHGGAFPWIQKHPGIVCLHDYFLGSLFWGWAAANKSQASAILNRHYGPSIAEDYFSHTTAESFISETCDTAPMTEWIASMAAGVITHSGWSINRVIRACGGPVDIVPLAYSKSSEITLSLQAAPAAAEKFTVMTFGHVNPNKRVEAVIQAIGMSRYRCRIEYRVVGKIEPVVKTKLVALAKKHAVNLQITGAVDDRTLSENILAADLVCCLRYPALEAASASTIEAMLHGKPVVVTDTGFYAELDATYVKKVSPRNEVGELLLILDDAIEHPVSTREFGLNARAWAEVTFGYEQYAGHLLSMATRVRAAVPVLKMGGYFETMLRNWGATGISEITRQTLAPLGVFSNDALVDLESVRRFSAESSR